MIFEEHEAFRDWVLSDERVGPNRLPLRRRWIDWEARYYPVWMSRRHLLVSTCRVVAGACDYDTICESTPPLVPTFGVESANGRSPRVRIS